MSEPAPADPTTEIVFRDVELNSGGPPMAIIERVTPGRGGDGTADLVVWWRATDGTPQIFEVDARCVRRTVADLIAEITADAAKGVTEVRLHPATFKRLVGYLGAKVTGTNGEPVLVPMPMLTMGTPSGPMIVSTDPGCTIEDYVYLHEVPAGALASTAL